MVLSGANPKNLALTVATAGSIAPEGLSTGGTTLAVAVFVLIGSLTVVGPVAFSMAASKRATGPLEAIRESCPSTTLSSCASSC